MRKCGMKKAVKIISFLTALLMVLTFVSGCEKKEEKIVGEWVSTVPHTKKQAEILLRNVSFQDIELKICDTSDLNYAKRLKFTKKGNYEFSYDTDETRQCVVDFYKKNFKLLYENRTKLNEIYKNNFEGMSEEEFYSFYTLLYGKQTFDEMINYFADIAYKYDDLGVIETGTFDVKKGVILFKVKGEKESGAVKYALKKDTLKLEYSNSTEKYQKEK